MEPAKYAEWAAPVVPVLKPDDTASLCGDYKLTVNQLSKLEQYPIPRIEDLFASLAGGQKFTKLDISHAYHQIPLDEEAKKFVTINTFWSVVNPGHFPANNGGTAAGYPSSGRVLG